MKTQMDYKSKWNKYTIGEIPWINSIREHPHRMVFLDYIGKNKDKIKSIIEIGAGEAIEAQSVIKEIPEMDYTIIDVSETFLKYARSIGFEKSFEMNMTKTCFKDRHFDLLYTSCTLEHSPNIEKSIKEMSRISKTFYITLFKWRMKTGDLVAKFRRNKNYFSSEWNIKLLLALIWRYGIISNMNIINKKTGEITEWLEYTSKLDDNLDLHRTGDYLSITGEWRNGIFD